MDLNEKIQIIRKNKGLSQEKLAEKLGISRQAVAKWENRESVPDISNLIQISDFFNISIDRLLKDDNCMNIINNSFDYNSSELIEFLVKAKKNTYASNNATELLSSRPESHDLKYEEGIYKYIDTYLGGERFIGEEAVFIDNKPVWAMNYNGIEVNEKFSSAFLKQALLTVDSKMPYRGQNKFQDGDYVYICEVNGDFEFFIGKEIIFFQDEKVYECNFSGGIVK